MANFTALAAARTALLARPGWNVEKDGMFGAPPIAWWSERKRTFASKALALVGLGRRRVTRLQVDGQGRMRADKLPISAIARFFACKRAT